MEIKNAIVKVEKVQSLLYAIEAVKERRVVVAIKILRSITGLSVHETAASITIACGKEPQGEVSEEAREVGLILKKFL